MSTPKKKKKTYKLLLAVDHTLINEGLRAIIDKQPDMQICGSSASINDTVKMLVKKKPDIIITDTSLQNSNWLELIKTVNSAPAPVPVMVTSMHSETIYPERALRSGAAGFVMKTEPSDEILKAIRTIIAGQRRLPPHLPPEILQRISGSDKRSRDQFGVDTLSDRELEVFEFIGCGQTGRQIAERLQLSIKTIETHRAHIKQKLKISTASELVHRAFHWVESGRQLG